MSVRRTLAAALAAGLLLAGCTDEPEPEFTPTETPSPSVTESETAEPEAQGPEEFIREWFVVNTAMQNTGDTAEFLGMSRNCEPCEDLADRIERIYRSGGFVELESQEVTAVQPGSRSSSIKQFDVTVRVAPTKYRESDGGKLQRYPGGTAKTRITLVRVDDAWFMDNLVSI